MKSQGIFNFLLSGNPAVSAPTRGRTSILFLLPDLHLHLYNFSFQTWISVYVALFSSCTFIFTSSAPITELLSLVILLLSQHLYVFSSAFSSTPTLHLCCLCAHSLTALARVHLYYFALVSTHSYLLNLHHHCPLYYICTCKFMYLFFHIDICISILTSQALLMVLTFTHVTKIYLKRLFFKHASEGQNLESIFKRHPVEQNIV